MLPEAALRMPLQARLYGFPHPLLQSILVFVFLTLRTHSKIINYTGWNERVTPLKVLTVRPALAPGGHLLGAPGANRTS